MPCAERKYFHGNFVLQNDSVMTRNNQVSSIFSKQLNALKQVSMAYSRREINDFGRLKPQQNFLLVWLDPNAHLILADDQNTLENLRAIVTDVQVVDHPDAAIDLLKKIDTETSFVITSGSFVESLIPCIHSFRNLGEIYIFCQNVEFYRTWSNEWNKVMLVHEKIEPIYEALQLAVKRCHQDSIAITFVDTETDSHDLNRLEPSFMYTTLLKDTLLKMKHEHDEEMTKFYQNALTKYPKKNINLTILNEFKRSYRSDEAIKWYTKQSFIYLLMNNSLRFLEGDVIVDMSFFIGDLHRQIVQLHQQQAEQFDKNKFIVYRGQALSEKDLERIQRRSGGLLGFNSFLSTSLKQEKSMEFARHGATKLGYVGVVFKMIIDPQLNKTPFANISELSAFSHEAEILFGMHTVFRIVEVRQMPSVSRLYEIELVLTAEDDPHLNELIKHIGENITGGDGYYRLGRILINMNELSKANEIFTELLQKNPSTRQKGLYNCCLGLIHFYQGQYEKAIEYYQISLEFDKQVLGPDDLNLACSYNNLGLVYDQMAEYSKALSNFEIALTIDKKTLPDTHQNLAPTYNNIGLVYDRMGEYSKALLNHTTALAIYKNTLPATHPNLASSYHNIGCVYYQLNEYSKALEHLEQALRINQLALPSDHPHLREGRRWIAIVKNKM